MSIQVQALVLGAGISGLTAAFALQKAGISALLIDSAARPGGVIQTIKRDGYLLEYGPQSFSGTPAINSLCTDLGLLGDRVFANPKTPRYVLLEGKLKPVSMGPGLLASSFLGGGTRGALLRDIFGHSEPPEPDESIASFMRRKFSDTLLERLAGPFVSGIYAGDPAALSLRAAFPMLHEAEMNSGSIVRGIFKIQKERKAKRGGAAAEKANLQTFRNGNETLIHALAEDLGDRLLCSTEISTLVALVPGLEPQDPRFRVNLRTSKGPEIIEAERLIVALPANAAARLLGQIDPGLESPLSGVEYAGVAVVSLGYRKSQIANPLTGFGFLVPRSSGLSVLGTVWNSSLFPGRAPEGHILLTSFLGGATNAGAIKKSGEELSALVHREIKPLLGITDEPTFTNVTIWPRAIPQYNLGHGAKLAAAGHILGKFPGLYLAGNYLNGPAIGSCIERALQIADEIRISFAN